MALFTRTDYLLANSAATTEAERMAHHRRYYAQFAGPGAIAYVVGYIGADALRASSDRSFNDIPLHRWDGLTHRLPLAVSFQSRGDYATLGGLVCVAKEAARQWLERTAEGVQP